MKNIRHCQRTNKQVLHNDIQKKFVFLHATTGHSLSYSARVTAPVEFKVTNASLKTAYQDLNNRKNPDLIR